ncbi:MAG TPA: pilus assembly protein TadG-related protein [Tepidisphaeraceae bacterium]|jgi:hypothetical protein
MKRFHTARNRGISLIYLTVTMVMLLGFSSLAIDYGRVQCVKTELQSAADAAARAAANNLPNGVTAVQNAAVAVAASNTADGSTVTLDATNDVEFGTWSNSASTFTVLTGAARSTANAVRITARRVASRSTGVTLSMTRTFGLASCDVSATCIGLLTTPPPAGLVGLNSVSISGSGNTNSFNSSTGTYSLATALSNGDVLSNGNITVAGTGIIHGDAHPGIGKTVSITGQGSVTGTKTPLNFQLRYTTPTLPATYMNAGAVNITSGTFTVSGGNYYCSSLNISNSATFNCQGPVSVYCSGPVSISGGTIKTYLNRPSNFQIFMLNSSSVTLNGQANFYATIYAPLSDFYQSGQADIYGSVIAKTLNFSGTWAGGVHYDESLGVMAAPSVSVVK